MVDPTPVLDEIEKQISRRRCKILSGRPWLDKTIHRTYNPACASCVAGRLHNEETWKLHPDAGSGIVDGREMRNPK